MGFYGYRIQIMFHFSVWSFSKLFWEFQWVLHIDHKYQILFITNDYPFFAILSKSLEGVAESEFESWENLKVSRHLNMAVSEMICLGWRNVDNAVMLPADWQDRRDLNFIKWSVPQRLESVRCWSHGSTAVFDCSAVMLTCLTPGGEVRLWLFLTTWSGSKSWALILAG